MAGLHAITNKKTHRSVMNYSIIKATTDDSLVQIAMTSDEGEGGKDDRYIQILMTRGMKKRKVKCDGYLQTLMTRVMKRKVKEIIT